VTLATSVVIGPDEHGVVRHALAVAAAAGIGVRRHLDVAECAGRRLDASGVVHWHFTDRLFGATVEDAATAFCALLASTPGSHVVTLHDVPAPTGAARDRRRAAGYAHVAGACRGVIVASHHERHRIEASGVARPGAVTVIPLPIASRPLTAPAGPGPGRAGRHVGVLGFVYPGKGHLDVVEAAGELPADVGIVAIGRASDGHEDLLATIQRAACAAGRRLVTTGFLDEDRLAEEIDRIDVPVVPATDVSASASIGSWIGAGRRPLVAVNGYTSELMAMAPDLVVPFVPGGLPAALRAALDAPETTRRSTSIPAPLTLDAVGRAHVALYRVLAP
jgi:glycosyltransferase involved in cell wall biosynthesis